MKINELRNRNRGFKNLEVWKKAIELYVLISKTAYFLEGKPYKVINQLIGSAYSVHANIAEGYCRNSLGEYLHFLNIAQSSLGELSSGIDACCLAGQLNKKNFNEIEVLHYEVENKLLKLISSLHQKKINEKSKHLKK